MALWKKLLRIGIPVLMLLGFAAAGTGVQAVQAQSGPVINITPSMFNTTYSAMSLLKPITAKGTGKIGALFPSCTGSARWCEFDPPMLREAFAKAGLPASDVIIENSTTDAQQYTEAQAMVAQGAKVLLLRDQDSGVGIRIETYAHQNGVAVIEYDVLTVGGTHSYFISFNNVAVGALNGEGLVKCISAWKVKNPAVGVFEGAATDNNTTQFFAGYWSVLKPLFASHKYTLVGRAARTWDPPTTLTEFEQMYTAHMNMNAALMPNDEVAAPVISYLQAHGIPPKTFPIGGMDATLVGLQNTLSGYQCGTAYKPIYLQAQGAAAVALYMRAGMKPPRSLLNGSVSDPTTHVNIPSVLFPAEWVTAANMNATIIHDHFVPASLLCGGKYATYCKAVGITP